MLQTKECKLSPSESNVSLFGLINGSELNRNRLTKIEGLTFDGLMSLSALRLRRNEISQLFDGAFFGLSSIQQL